MQQQRQRDFSIPTFASLHLISIPSSLYSDSDHRLPIATQFDRKIVDHASVPSSLAAMRFAFVLRAGPRG
jgi:hypothetical protein